MKSETFFVIFIPAMIISVMAFAVYGAFASTYNTLIVFGVLASIIIGAIIYVSRLPNAVPNDNPSKESLK